MIINQWVNYLDKDTSFELSNCKLKKLVEICKEDFESYFKEPEENNAVIDKHLYICIKHFIIRCFFVGKIVYRLIH